jgi:hypothetical protein
MSDAPDVGRHDRRLLTLLRAADTDYGVPINLVGTSSSKESRESMQPRRNAYVLPRAEGVMSVTSSFRATK